MRFFLFMCVCVISFGCVQIENGTVPTPVPTPDIKPDELTDANVDQVFLSKILTDASATKTNCMRYAALFKAFSQTFRERSDVPAKMIMDASVRTAQQFIKEPSAIVVTEVQTLASVEKDRESLAKAFDRLSATLRAASLKK
jgi:hypothetical protein